jgi:hypothetical protein
MKIEIHTEEDWVCGFIAAILESDIKMLEKLSRKLKKKRNRSAIDMEDYSDTEQHLQALKQAIKYYIPASHPLFDKH